MSDYKVRTKGRKIDISMARVGPQGAPGGGAGGGEGAGVFVGPTAPEFPVEGTLWYACPDPNDIPSNGDAQRLYIWLDEAQAWIDAAPGEGGNNVVVDTTIIGGEIIAGSSSIPGTVVGRTYLRLDRFQQTPIFIDVQDLVGGAGTGNPVVAADYNASNELEIRLSDGTIINGGTGGGDPVVSANFNASNELEIVRQSGTVVNAGVVPGANAGSNPLTGLVASFDDNTDTLTISVSSTDGSVSDSVVIPRDPTTLDVIFDDNTRDLTVRVNGLVRTVNIPEALVPATTVSTTFDDTTRELTVDVNGVESSVTIPGGGTGDGGSDWRNEGDTDFLTDVNRITIDSDTNLQIVADTTTGDYIIQRIPVEAPFDFSIGTVQRYNQFSQNLPATIDITTSITGTLRMIDRVTVDGALITDPTNILSFPITRPLTNGSHNVVIQLDGTGSLGTERNNVSRSRTWMVVVPYFTSVGPTAPTALTQMINSNHTFNVNDSVSFAGTAENDRGWIAVEQSQDDPNSRLLIQVGNVNVRPALQTATLSGTGLDGITYTYNLYDFGAVDTNTITGIVLMT